MKVKITKQNQDITVTFTAVEKQMDHSRITALHCILNMEKIEYHQPMGSTYSTRDGTGTFVDTLSIRCKDVTASFENRLAQWVFTGESL
jgi:hypothetical protein